MEKKNLADVDLDGKRVLVRVDFNVPLAADADGRQVVADDQRIRAALPTLARLREAGASAILMSHLGRPKDRPEAAYSLAPVAVRLAELLGQPVLFVPDCVGPEVEAAAKALGRGEVLLLENVRFHPGEKANDPAFAAQLASLGEVYVNDAFGTAHRADASTAGVPAILHPAVAGLLLEKELAYLERTLAAPERPFVAILGGAKVGDKIGVIENLLPKVDALLIGGGMANTFLAALDLKLGESLVEPDAIEEAMRLLGEGGDKIVLPVDAVVADAFSADAETRTAAVGAVPEGWRILDVGPATIERFSLRLEGARTVVWNGPMGVFEMAPFARGTFALAEILAELTEAGATTIVGGGDSAAAVEKAGLAHAMSHISTGGGASLELLEGKVLPGVAALDDAG